MQKHASSLSFSVLAFAATAVLAQSANIFNYCNFDIYLWPVDCNRPAGPPITISPGYSYSELYHTPSNGGGVSLKLNTVQSLDIITQFEYTLTESIWYDGSNVNCHGTDCPFYQYGAYLDASDASCPNRTCMPNQICTGFYTYPADDINTLACEPNADINLYLCTTGPGASAASAVTQSTSGGPSLTTSAQASTSASSAVCVAEPVTTTTSKISGRRYQPRG